jgi:hypothetical protein
LLCAATLASAQIPDTLILRPKHRGDPGIAGTFHSPLYDPGDSAGDRWIWPARLAVFLDADTTFEGLNSKPHFVPLAGHPGRGVWKGLYELNPLYHGLNEWQTPIAVLGVGYLVERAITGIHDRTWRNIAGWAFVAFETFCALDNASKGAPILTVRF